MKTASESSKSVNNIGIEKCDVDTLVLPEDTTLVMGTDATLQRADHIHQLSRSETHRGMLNDSSNNNVINGLDFDDPPDCNLDDEARHLDQLIAAGWKAINSQALSISFTDTSNEAPGVNATASALKRASGSEMNDKEIKISRYKCRDLQLNRSLHFDCSHTARPPGAAAA